MPNMMYGRMVPVRGLETSSRGALQTERYRKPELAIREKMKVLDHGKVDFDILGDGIRAIYYGFTEEQKKAVDLVIEEVK